MQPVIDSIKDGVGRNLKRKGGPTPRMSTGVQGVQDGGSGALKRMYQKIESRIGQPINGQVEPFIPGQKPGISGFERQGNSRLLEAKALISSILHQPVPPNLATSEFPTQQLLVRQSRQFSGSTALAGSIRHLVSHNREMRTNAKTIFQQVGELPNGKISIYDAREYMAMYPIVGVNEAIYPFESRNFIDTQRGGEAKVANYWDNCPQVGVGTMLGMKTVLRIKNLESQCREWEKKVYDWNRLLTFDPLSTVKVSPEQRRAYFRAKAEPASFVTFDLATQQKINEMKTTVRDHQADVDAKFDEISKFTGMKAEFRAAMNSYIAKVAIAAAPEFYLAWEPVASPGGGKEFPSYSYDYYLLNKGRHYTVPIGTQRYSNVLQELPPGFAGIGNASQFAFTAHERLESNTKPEQMIVKNTISVDMVPV